MFRQNRAAWKLALILSVWAAMPACRRSPEAREAAFLSRGQKLFEHRDYARAALEFRNAISAVGRDAEPYYRLGLTELAAGNPAEAVAALRRATELNPKHEAAQLKVAELQTGTRVRAVIEDASLRLQKVLKASPENIRAGDLLALAEWKLGNTEEALKRLETTLEKFPSSLSSSVLLARLKLKSQDFAGAEQVLREAVDNAPNSSDALLALAEVHVLSKKPDQAEVELLHAIQLDPANGRALMGLAAIQASTNRPEQAERTYRRLAELPGKEFKPLHALFLFQTGKREAALEELRTQVRDDPKDILARRRLVAACFAMQRFDEADHLLAADLQRNPKDADALLLRSELRLKSGKVAEAQSDLQQVIHESPDSAEAHLAMSHTYAAQGLEGVRRQELARAVELNPLLLEARTALARSYTLNGQARTAEELMEKAPPGQRHLLPAVIERNWALLETGEQKTLQAELTRALAARRDPTLLLQQALLQFREQNYAAARATAEEELKLNPDDLRAMRVVAETYGAQNQPLKAIETLSQMTKAYPKAAPLHYLLASWYARLGDRHASRRTLEATLSADPKYIPALLLIAQFDAAAGERDAAVARYRTVLGIDAANLVALNNAAYILALQNPDEALAMAQKAAEISPDNPAVQDTLGWVYYRKSAYRSAIDCLTAAINREPTPKRRFHLAMSYIRAGNRDVGQPMLQTALQQDPNLTATERGW